VMRHAPSGSQTNRIKESQSPNCRVHRSPASSNKCNCSAVTQSHTAMTTHPHRAHNSQGASETATRLISRRDNKQREDSTPLRSHPRSTTGISVVSPYDYRAWPPQTARVQKDRTDLLVATTGKFNHPDSCPANVLFPYLERPMLPPYPLDCSHQLLEQVILLAGRKGSADGEPRWLSGRIRRKRAMVVLLVYALALCALLSVVWLVH